MSWTPVPANPTGWSQAEATAETFTPQAPTDPKWEQWFTDEHEAVLYNEHHQGLRPV
jgi:hypothetical protein